ncbi:MAG: hypothetical protein KIH69_014330 [Anaerolineae bacterium]|nr:hypothetical protein [Anaerolineae bacterium]
MFKYSLPLALHDFTPVIFAFLGFLALARMGFAIRRDVGRLMIVGATLTLMGGLGKAVWKLIIALSEGGIDVRVLDNGLFFWMAPGFTLMAYGMSYVKRLTLNRPLRRDNIWLVPVIAWAVIWAVGIAAALARPDSRTWNLIWLAVTSVGQLIVSSFAVTQALRQGQKPPAILLIVNFVAVLALTGLARAERNLTNQWTEQIINMCSYAAFAYACHQIAQKCGERESSES